MIAENDQFDSSSELPFKWLFSTSLEPKYLVVRFKSWN